MPDVIKVRHLITLWTHYRSIIPVPKRYEKLAFDLYQVRNAGKDPNPPITSWPAYLIDTDDENMACLEHYFLTRSWIGNGLYPAWQARGMVAIYDKGKEWGLTPRHNRSKPVTPPSAEQKMFQEQGIKDGEADLAAAKGSAPYIGIPPKYY